MPKGLLRNFWILSVTLGWWGNVLSQREGEKTFRTKLQENAEKSKAVSHFYLFMAPWCFTVQCQPGNLHLNAEVIAIKFYTWVLQPILNRTRNACSVVGLITKPLPVFLPNLHDARSIVPTYRYLSICPTSQLTQCPLFKYRGVFYQTLYLFNECLNLIVKSYL